LRQVGISLHYMRKMHGQSTRQCKALATRSDGRKLKAVSTPAKCLTSWR